MPSPPCDRSSDRSTCVNISKMLGQHLGGDADAVVPHRHDDVAALLLARQPDATAPLGVLGALLSRLANTWASRVTVGVQVDRLGRQRDRQFVARRLDQRAAGFHGVLHRRRQVDPLLAQFDLAVGDAGHVEQVVHEADHVPKLPLHHACGPALPPPGRRSPGGRLAGRCGSGPAGCGVRGPGSPGTRLLRRSASRKASSARLRSVMSTRTFTAPTRLAGLVVEAGWRGPGRCRRLPSGRSTMISCPLYSLLSWSARAIQHRSCAIGDPSSREEPERAAVAVHGVVQLRLPPP